MRGGASAGGGACTADMGGRSPGAGTRLPLPARRWTETPAVEPFQIPRPVLSFLLLPSPTSGGFRSGEEERRAALGGSAGSTQRRGCGVLGHPSGASPTASSSAGGKPIVLNWPLCAFQEVTRPDVGPHSRKPLVPGETRPDPVLVVKCLVDGLSPGPGCPPPPQPVLLLRSCPQWACWRAAPGASSSPARDQLTPHTLPGGRRGPYTHLSPSCHAARESSSRLSHGPHPGAPG
ncbi:uncharacterized protein LOC111560213 isoform X2 [Felis catus]|uniref:uncharacterized protein LOC111560213 isoform X2 n=1 Tax=Felis catus TaxID=9685 RepID=UPI001D19CE81|nr:uncharacterized protein LOC111560213 isoform X2 [Felis catus]